MGALRELGDDDAELAELFGDHLGGRRFEFTRGEAPDHGEGGQQAHCPAQDEPETHAVHEGAPRDIGEPAEVFAKA